MLLLDSCGVALACLVLSACGGASTSEPATGPGGGGAAGVQTSSGGSLATGGTASKGSTCSLTFVFTTVDNRGQFSPRNVSAVWVTNAQGAFVRTLEENGYIRQEHLSAWEQASSGSTVDAVTGATNSAPRTHQTTWDCTDESGNGVASGSYALNAEFATDNGFFTGAPPLLQVNVTVGGGRQALHPPDAAYFTGIDVTLQ